MSTFFRYCRSFFRRPTTVGSGKGFTLVELLVVVGIIVVITSFILLRHSRFNSSTLLRSLAYSVALSVRQAQVYGTAVRGVSVGSTVSYSSGYGVYFSTSLGCSGGTNTCYALFSDLNGDRAWSVNETVATSTLGRTYVIQRFCGMPASGVAQCSDSGTPITSLTLYFRRPNPEASIYSSACTFSSCATPYNYAYIDLQTNADSATRAVKVTNVGQITVCKPGEAIATC